VKNAAKAIRNAYYNALGSVTYNTVRVPVYKNVPVERLPDHYIEITSIDEVNDPNDQKFIREVNLTLEVVSTQYRYRTYDVVDEISEDVQQIILSSVGGSLTDTNFQIGHIQLDSSRYLDEDDNERFITRKILQFNQILIQF
jgi:hypothetical protein